MLYTSGKVPKPVNSDGYFVKISSPFDSTIVSQLSALLFYEYRLYVTDLHRAPPRLPKTFDQDHTVFLWASSALRSFMTSVTTVDSASVSNLKQIYFPSTSIVLHQVLSPSQPIVLRNVTSPLPCSISEVTMPTMAFVE